MKIQLYIQPGARRSEICGRHDGKIKIKINSPPVDGTANEELTHFLSDWLNLPKSSIELIAGHKSRHKIFLLKVENKSQLNQIQQLIDSI